MLLYTSEKKYLPLVQEASQKYGVPTALILGHIKQESAFNPLAYRAEPAINDASMGLMQVLERTAKTIDPNATLERLKDPAYNINIGTAYIAQNLKRYNNNVKDAIAAYNAGTARKDAEGYYVNSKGVRNVQGYVDKVYKNYENYTTWLAEGADTVSLTNFDPLDPWLIFSVLGLGVVFILVRRYYAKR